MSAISAPVLSGQDAFALVEATWAAREGGPEAIARALGAGRYAAVAIANPGFEQLVAGLPDASPFAALELRHRRTGGAGLAVLPTRPGRGPTREAVEARHGPGTWWDVRPEHAVSALAYERPGGWVSFGFARGGGAFVRATVEWGLR